MALLSKELFRTYGRILKKQAPGEVEIHRERERIFTY
jgi:hypothetical protein